MGLLGRIFLLFVFMAGLNFVVHGVLYGFGLRFSFGWAVFYWWFLVLWFLVSVWLLGLPIGLALAGVAGTFGLAYAFF